MRVSSGNYHQIHIFHPIKSKIKPTRWKSVLVVVNDNVIAARWTGTNFLDIDGEPIKNVEWWGFKPHTPKFER